MEEVILIGYFCETVELCELCGFKIFGVVDSNKIEKYKYLGNDEDFSKNYKEYLKYKLILTPDRPEVREKLYNHYSSMGFSFKTLVSPKALVSPTASISEGCMIQSLCNVSSETKLGKCVRLNVGANVMHNDFVEDFSVIAPNAVLLGNVNIGKSSYIGANSTILPGIKIGNNSIVGAGAVVTKNIEEDIVVTGVPARFLRKKEKDKNEKKNKCDYSG